MKSSRRELRNAALVAGSLPVSRHLAALGERTSSLSEIRKMLAAKRATIRTLYVDYQYRSSPPGDVDLAGRHQMFFDRGRYHFRLSPTRADVEIIEILNADKSLTAFVAGNTVAKLDVRDRTRREPAMSVGSFLPVPADRPMTPRGRQTLAGQHCQGILQGSDCYWVDLGPGVVRAVDTYRSEEWVSGVTTFDGFVQISETLQFPHLLRRRRLDANGDTIKEEVEEVTAVALNEPLPEELFAIDAFPKLGERPALE